MQLKCHHFKKGPAPAGPLKWLWLQTRCSFALPDQFFQQERDHETDQRTCYRKNTRFDDIFTTDIGQDNTKRTAGCPELRAMTGQIAHSRLLVVLYRGLAYRPCHGAGNGQVARHFYHNDREYGACTEYRPAYGRHHYPYVAKAFKKRRGRRLHSFNYVHADVL